jgi:hypothetical protein
MKRDSVFARLLSCLLAATTTAGSLVGMPATARASGIDESAPAESFSFAEKSAPSTQPLREGAAASAVKKRKAPVSTSGAFGYSIPIDVPPGRLGMTPALALSYASGASRTDGAAGAGWSLPVRAIRRSARHGFPATKLEGGKPAYDDAGGFESPHGELVPAPDGPSAGFGAMYMPARETEPVRYEYVRRSTVPGPPTFDSPTNDLMAGDYWVEHDPSGVKRTYGAFATSSARVRNELGTHAWLLLEEADRDGNSISYRYHHSEQADRADLNAPQDEPLLAEVRWGGNTVTGQAHVFSLSTQISSQQGGIDMLHGHVVASSRLDRVVVRGPSAESGPTALYWQYDLGYRTSLDSGRALLESVARNAPESPGGSTLSETQKWVFDYTSNGGALRWDSNGQELVPGAHGIYQDNWFDVPASQLFEKMTPSEELEFFWSPKNSRSAAKLLDFDGNGTLDIVFHPSGLRAPTARMLPELSRLRKGTQWEQVTDFGAWFNLAYQPNPPIASELADLDGDLDQDLVVFPVTSLAPGQAGGASYGGGTDSPERGQVSALCQAVAKGCCPGGLTCGQDYYPPNAECLGGQCPHEMGIEAFIYPSEHAIDALQHTLYTPFLDPYLADSQPEPGGMVPYSGGGFCGGASALCQALYGGTLIAGVCDDPAKVCENANLSYVCGRRCALERGEHPEPSGREHVFAINHNRARGGSGWDFRSVPKWPIIAVDYVGIGKVKLETEPANYVPSHPRPVTFAEHFAPLADLNADGLPDLVLLKHTLFWRGKTAFVPRAYLNLRDKFDLDRQVSPALGFTDSAWQLLANRVDESCYAFPDAYAKNTHCDEALPYPPSENFNTFLMDLNADGLPDLVAAQPPVATAFNPLRRCVPGHQVFLNRGYAWDTSASAWSAQSWSTNNSQLLTDSQIDAHPFLLVRNYQPTSDRSYYPDAHCTAQTIQGALAPLPHGLVSSRAMAQADLNADGRPDILVAAAVFEHTGPGGSLSDAQSPPAIAFLNTGRGFRKHVFGPTALPLVS